MARASEIRTRAREAADEVQRDHIADATCEVIAAEGLEAASLRRIAEALDSTTGLITHYFASKDDLLVRALERATERLTGTPTIGTAADTTLAGRLQAFYATLPTQDEARMFWLVLVAFRGASIGNQRLAAVYERFGFEALEVMRRAVAAELSRPVDDPEVIAAASAIDAVLEGFGACAALAPERFHPDMVRTRVDAAVAGIVAAARGR
jgi:AcrR family transcriptional regulator